MIRIIIAGSRKFNDYSTLSNIVDHILKLRVYKKGYKPNDIEVVCGMAKGADTLGERYAKLMVLKSNTFLPNGINTESLLVIIETKQWLNMLHIRWVMVL